MARSFKTAAAFRQALEQRLKGTAETSGVPLSTLRLKVIIERLLARLFAHADPPWLLKGGYAMELRYRPHARTTKDIDLAVRGTQDSDGLEDRIARIRERLQTSAAADLGDFFQFLISAAQRELQGAPQGGARFPVEARLAGRVFGRFHVDIGVGDAIVGAPEHLTGDNLLAFAGIPAAQAFAIPRAQQFAEKFHAYTFPWTDRPNTRTRDLVDLLLILERDAPDVDDIASSIEATFKTRQTHPVPERFPPPPDSWAAEFSSMAAAIELATRDLGDGYERLVRFWQACRLKHRFLGP